MGQDSSDCDGGSDLFARHRTGDSSPQHNKNKINSVRVPLVRIGVLILSAQEMHSAPR